MSRGHDLVSYDFGTPRQYTRHKGWNISCECGKLLGDTGNMTESDELYEKHLLEVEVAVLAPGGPVPGAGRLGRVSALWKKRVDR